MLMASIFIITFLIICKRIIIPNQACHFYTKNSHFAHFSQFTVTIIIMNTTQNLHLKKVQFSKFQAYHKICPNVHTSLHTSDVSGSKFFGLRFNIDFVFSFNGFTTYEFEFLGFEKNSKVILLGFRDYVNPLHHQFTGKLCVQRAKQEQKYSTVGRIHFAYKLNYGRAITQPR